MRAAVLVLLIGAASSFVEQSEWAAFKLNHAKSYANPIEEFYRMKVRFQMSATALLLRQLTEAIRTRIVCDIADKDVTERSLIALCAGSHSIQDKSAAKFFDI